MSLYEDLKPFLTFSKMFGLAPYSVSGIDVNLSRIWIAHSTFCILVNIYLVYLRYTGFMGPDIKLRFLTVFRTAFAAFLVSVDILICILSHGKLQASLIFMQRYDQAVKLKRTPKTLIIRCWIGLVATVVYFIYLGWLTYIYEDDEPFESAVIYFVVYTATTSSILKFSAIVASLLYRFRHLNFLIKAGSWTEQSGWQRGQLTLRDAWFLHNVLVAAARELNSLYSIQLLLWIIGLTFNIISRIYVIFDTEHYFEVAKMCRESGLAAIFIFLLTALAGVCHLTAAEANKVGSVAFSPDSNIFQRHRATSNSEIEESMQIGLYFLYHRLNFSAASGLLQVDLPLLQTIAGTMTTYLVILKSPG
ncbi:uncharacterized protein [Venturia canescens]|uniref:uncharacterized protein n=1 Tax=Venturia canescens TaxID=32260 RepID=UPI001C9BF400|nr:uncharacterized protein LOC122407409 [Venturia canescens]